ncbi:MAG: hypothetical protein C0497_14075 [Gemmatimonas sp.]|nr:hypothetical protein [Gemmatimonas sp.]
MPPDRSEPEFVPLTSYREYPPDEMLRRARDFAADMQRRRTVRQFSDRPVPREIIECCLETAPYLIAVFAERYGVNPDGSRRTHYYVNESVGIAMGFLIAALHHAGLSTLTHTPSPMGFLGPLLQRPANERAVLLLVVGYPAPDARVPQLTRKPLSSISTFL